MNKMYFTGYVTSGKKGPTYTQNSNLAIGKKYIVEEYETQESWNGNGGSSYSTLEKYVRVYSLKGELVSDREWPSVFSCNKECTEHNLAYENGASSTMRCSNCFRRFKNKLIEV
jgi:hypothetical protein